MAHASGIYQRLAAATCPAPMTRAALLSLRASSGLDPECVYTITDHVQNRLVAGTTITLYAVSANELSHHVEVNTTYDNEAWPGMYDIDRALVLELEDNRGNVAKGYNGTEVANFDWGNAAYTGCRLENSSWIVSYGNSALMARVSVYNLATLNTTGFVGAMQDNRIHTATNVNFTNANGTWRYSEWKNIGNFNATGYTGGGDSYYNEIDNCAISLVGQTAVVNLRTSEFQNCNFTFAGAQTVQIQGSQFYAQTINRPATGGPLNINQGSSREGGAITHTGTGSLSLAGTQNNGTVSATGAGSTAINYASIDQTSSVNHAGLAALTINRTTLQGANSSITVDSGAATPVTVNESELRSSGLIRVIGATGGGAFSVIGSRIDSSGFVYKRHTGALALNQCSIRASSGIDAQSGNRSYDFVRCEGTEVARVTLTGTGAVTDSFADLDMRHRGQVNVSCSGPANQIFYGEVSGLSGSLSLTGTTGSQSINRTKLRDGSLSYSNTTVNMGLVMSTAEDAGTITFNGVAAAKSASYLHARNGASITVNNSTGGGAIQGVEVSSFGQYVISGAAASATYVTAQQGTVSHNGGNLIRCEKRQGGTLTTGNFNHNGIIHATNVNTTLTAANTARALYMGLAPAAYAAGGILI